MPDYLVNPEPEPEMELIASTSVSTNSQFMMVPSYDTSFKACMDYRTLTARSSDQYQLQHSPYVWTDAYGLRRYNDDYIVAMGTYYTPRCGARFRVTFDTGNVITVLVGDIKADIHTDSLNQYSAVRNPDGSLYSANVLEFIADTTLLPKNVWIMGSVDVLDHLAGNITAIEKISDAN